MKMSMKEGISVVAAIVMKGKHFMLCRRGAQVSNSGLWEFPGGKQKKGESLEQALVREVREELYVGATVNRLLAFAETTDSGRTIRLHGFETTLDREPTKFKDHSELKWFKLDELLGLPTTPAEQSLFKDLISKMKIEKGRP